MINRLEFDHWDLIRTEINYIAMDEDGEWHGYENKPIRAQAASAWGCIGGFYRLSEAIFPQVTDWTKSLIKRPER